MIPPISQDVPRTLIRTGLVLASVLLAAPSVMAQSAALEAIENNESNQRVAAAQTRANQEAAGQSGAAKYFSAVAPGVVKDSRTGLQWMRCTLGQDWSKQAKTCTGRVNEYTWQEAQDIAEKFNQVGGYASHTNWRVPTARELQSLRYCSNGFVSDRGDLQDGGGSVPSYCADGSTRPTIAQAIFPAMDSENLWYWSSCWRSLWIFSVP